MTAGQETQPMEPGQFADEVAALLPIVEDRNPTEALAEKVTPG
jgi:hypothetical protein